MKHPTIARTRPAGVSGRGDRFRPRGGTDQQTSAHGADVAPPRGREAPRSSRSELGRPGDLR